MFTIFLLTLLQSDPKPADFRGLAVVSDKVVWVSGTHGTVGRTEDGGKNWKWMTIPGAETLDLRDIEAVSETEAYVLSIGPGDKSRIYKSSDAGRNWKCQFTNADKDAFFDAIAFWDRKHGIALSDPVKGKYFLIHTTDGGETWKPLDPVTMPDALPGEGAFAASGTCLVTRGKEEVHFVTGGAKVARLFSSFDGGKNWTVKETTIQAGVESAGIFSLAFIKPNLMILCGGDYKQPAKTGNNLLLSNDGGKTWTSTTTPLPFLSCVCGNEKQLYAVGIGGAYLSLNAGKSWEQIDTNNFNVVSMSPDGTCWAAGPKGKLLRLSGP